MVMQRDFLSAGSAAAAGSNPSELAAVLAEHVNTLGDIALYLRQQNSDVLCSVNVSGGAQGTNAILDTGCHEVKFMVGGKPVEIYRLLAFSTYTKTVGMSILSMANVNDGIPFVAGVSMEFAIPTNSVFLQASALAGGKLIVNGPADVTNGGFFLYGFTIPDFDRIRGSRRS